jgi:CDP-ribitol ribitolphosphotransferase
MQGKSILKYLLCRFAIPLIYRAAKLTQRVDNSLVLFADTNSDEMPFSMKNLYCEAVKRRFNTKIFCLDYGQNSWGTTFAHIVSFLVSYARAKYVFICNYNVLVSSCKKRSETTVIQLWHAVGMIKKFGYDSNEDIPGSSRFNYTGNFDMVTVGSEACLQFYQSAFLLRKGECMPLGISRTDSYYEGAFIDKCKRWFIKEHPEYAGKKIALWAPTFRGRASMATVVGFNEISELDLGPDWVVIIKLHPLIKNEHDVCCRSILPTEYLLPSVELLITDYSTVLFEFGLFLRPIVLYVPDYENYAERRGLYYDINEIPVPIVKDASVLSSACIQEYAAFEPTKLRAFIRKYAGMCDGAATERIANYLWLPRNAK